MKPKIVTDHGFPRGVMPDDDPFDLFKNERDYIAKVGRSKTTVAAMDWATAEISRMRAALEKTIAWLGKLAEQSEQQERQNRGRFNSLADACAADAKNYRATANGLRKALGVHT